MINYELAKQLKDAGFPINKTVWEELFYIGEPTEKDFEREWDKCTVFHPNLPELIEACGDDFRTLEKYNKEEVELFAGLGDTRKWAVFGTKKDRHKDHLALIPNYYGNTPEEAVAKLWLALNG